MFRGGIAIFLIFILSPRERAYYANAHFTERS